jgi:hypothetical protein
MNHSSSSSLAPPPETSSAEDVYIKSEILLAIETYTARIKYLHDLIESLERTLATYPNEITPASLWKNWLSALEAQRASHFLSLLPRPKNSQPLSWQLVAKETSSREITWYFHISDPNEPSLPIMASPIRGVNLPSANDETWRPTLLHGASKQYFIHYKSNSR